MIVQLPGLRDGGRRGADGRDQQYGRGTAGIAVTVSLSPTFVASGDTVKYISPPEAGLSGYAAATTATSAQFTMTTTGSLWGRIIDQNGLCWDYSPM